MTINSSTSHLYPVKGKYLDYILEKLKFHIRATIHLLQIIFNKLLTPSCHKQQVFHFKSCGVVKISYNLILKGTSVQFKIPAEDGVN